MVTQQRNDLQALRASTRSLLRTIEPVSDDQMQEPSRLPGWNRAMLLTHIARNADGVRNMVEHATRDEYGDMYPGGIDQRGNDIDAGADARAADVIHDVRHSADLLMEAWEALPVDAGERRGRTLSAERTMDDMLFVRLREVELHHVDLNLGYEVSDWPVGFVSASLDQIFSTFDQRGASTRPRLDANYRIVSTDHDEAWRVLLRAGQVRVTPDDASPADGEARGWGCDIAAWLYGRDPRGGGVTASGDLTVLRLPTWFPYA